MQKQNSLSHSGEAVASSNNCKERYDSATMHAYEVEYQKLLRLQQQSY